MPNKQAITRAKQDAREGKSASTQAGEFVKQQMDEIRAGKHGARNTKQAIAIGLSEARRAGVPLDQPKKGTVSDATRKKAARDTEKGQNHEPVSPTRSEARVKALKKESTAAASPKAISEQTRSAAAKRSPADRSAAAKKASATKGAQERSAAAKKAAQTRASNGTSRTRAASKTSGTGASKSTGTSKSTGASKSTGTSKTPGSHVSGKSAGTRSSR